MGLTISQWEVICMISTNLTVDDGIRRVAQDAYLGERSNAQKKIEGPEIMCGSGMGVTPKMY